MQLNADHVIELDSSPVERFLGDTALFSDSSKPSFVTVRLPDLALPTGEVYAADGLIMQGFPFTRRLKPGRHELRLVLTRLPKGSEFVAFAILGKLADPVASFEMALTVGQDLAHLNPGNVYGYPVDAGVGSFSSPEAHAALGRVEDLYELAGPTMETVSKPSRDWCTIDTGSGTAALFTSGYGDGLYASFFGLDEAGDAVSLVTDFSLVDWMRNPMRIAP